MRLLPGKQRSFSHEKIAQQGHLASAGPCASAAGNDWSTCIWSAAPATWAPPGMARPRSLRPLTVSADARVPSAAGTDRAVPASACVSDGDTVVADLSRACLSSSFTPLVRPVNCWAWITEAGSSGACGYGAMAAEINGGFLAACGPRQHRGGLSCGRCFQVLPPAVFFSPRIARFTSPCCCFFLLSCPSVCLLESGWQQSTFFAALLCCTRTNLSVPWIAMLRLRVFLAQQSSGVDGAVVVGCSYIALSTMGVTYTYIAARGEMAPHSLGVFAITFHHG
jgi:hypothetical protein